jgi:glycine cleavage system regulatory protein
MRKTLLLTLVGTDRTGLVESLADKVAALGANWEESRMARLSGQFAGIVLVTIESDKTDALIADLRQLESKGLSVTARLVEAAPSESFGTAYQLVVTGNDRPGIVRDVSRTLSERGVNVEELETTVESAPMTGGPLFVARARVRVPGSSTLGELRGALEKLGGELVIDLTAE